MLKKLFSNNNVINIFFVNKYYKYSSSSGGKFVVIKNSQNPTTKKMNIVYFSHLPNENFFHITFYLKNENFGINRQFNFKRQLTECVNVCIDRMSVNIQKDICKKNKTKFRKKKDAIANVNEEVRLPIDAIQLLRTKDDNYVKLDTEKFEDIFLNQHNLYDNLRLKLFDEHYCVAINYPMINSIELPTILLTDCYAHPCKLDIQFGNVNENIFIWCRGLQKNSNDNDIEWEQIADTFFYKIKSNDLNYKLKLICTPKNGNLIGPTVECISDGIIQVIPNNSSIEKRQTFTKNKLNGNVFRIMSYNLLADYYCDGEYAHEELFNYCPIEYLNINYRKQLFINEIINYNSDVICLQEVDSKIFDLDLKPILWNVDRFNGIFKKKGDNPEGLAIFYNTQRFKLIHEYGINIGENLKELNIFAALWKKIENNTNLTKRICDLGTAIQVAVLKSIENDKILIVANTHLYFHPDADHIRLLQIGFSMLYIEDIYKQMLNDLNLINEDNANLSSNISIIFCGDFNSTPECGIYKLMTEKLVESDFIDFKSNEKQAVHDVNLAQPFNFKSAYTNFTFSNYTLLFTGWLDYIFYQTDNLRVVQVVPVPSESELSVNKAIPSICFPSDHIPLISDLEWIN